MIRKAKRLDNISPYLFAEIDKKKEEAVKRGVKVLSLGIGDPDLPTPPHVVSALYESAKIVSNQKYPPMRELKNSEKRSLIGMRRDLMSPWTLRGRSSPS